MSTRPRPFISPLSLAGLVTVLAIGLSFGFEPGHRTLIRWSLLGTFIALFLIHDRLTERGRLRATAIAAQAAVALLMVCLEPRTGTTPILLVVVIAQLGMLWPPRRVLIAAIVLNTALYLLLHNAGFGQPLLLVMINGGFQAFAALTAHYARSAERTRDDLARVNADLLATRALLADSARDAERLRLSRELHDVAGHKLTAMRINLRALTVDPALAGRNEIVLAEQLSAELLADIRRVVQSMRDDRGLDLATALRALAAPFPRPQLQLGIASDVRVTDPLVAETVLRFAQEALTNAARHADADTVWLDITTEEKHLRIDIRDDGQRGERIREGNGIAGMRERLAELHGQLELGQTERGGMHLTARLPA